MDTNGERHVPARTWRSSFAWLTGSFVTPLVGDAAHGRLDEDGLLHDGALAADGVHAQLAEQWAAEQARASAASKPPSLGRAVWRAFRYEVLTAAGYKLGWGLFVVLCAAFFVRRLLDYVTRRAADLDHTPDEAAEGYLVTVFFFVCALLMGICLQQMAVISGRLGQRVSAAMATAVYRKSLVEDRQASLASGTQVDVLALVSTDCAKLGEACNTLQYLWSGCVEALAIIGVLLAFTGKSALPGLGALIILVPVQYVIGQRIAKNRKAVVAAADARVSLMDEVLRAIKLVKMYVWQDKFADSVAALRRKEMRLARVSGVLKSVLVATVFWLPPAIALAIFGVHAIEEPLKAVLAFTTLSLFNTLRLPLVQLPKGLRAAAEASAALQRLQQFLLAPERPARKLSSAPGIYLQEASYAYGENAAPLLKSLSLEISAGSLVMVAGGVGSGKSNFINALLGRMTLVGGQERITDAQVAYVPQTPWCAHGTLRDNILFGLPFDEAKYRRVIFACALEHDLRILQQADLTEVGERGCALSGGQRQRVALARAAYSGASLVFLDSPLSAVDAYTSQHIFRHCIQGLMRGSSRATVVLCTHQVELFPHADQLLVMADGECAYQGRFTPAVAQRFFPNAAAPPDADEHLAAALQLDLDGSRSRAQSAAVPPHDMRGSPAQSGTPRLEATALAGTGVEGGPGPLALAGDDALDPRGTRTARAMTLRADVLRSLDSDGAQELPDETAGSDVAVAVEPASAAAPHARPALPPLHPASHQGSGALPPSRASSVTGTPTLTSSKTRARTMSSQVVLTPPPGATIARMPSARMGQSGASGSQVPASDLPLVLPGSEPVKSRRPPPAAPRTVNGYWALFLALSPLLAFISLCIFVITQLCRIFADIWISTWVAGRNTQVYYTSVYAGYVAAFLALLLLRGLFWYGIAGAAASRLHNRMFKSVLLAPMGYFNTTPLGGLLSIFSRDMDQIDEALQDNVMMFTIYLCILGTTLGVVIRVLPYMAAVGCFLLLAFAVLFHFYLKTSRAMKRIAGLAQADVVAHVSETLQGLAVVQAYRAEDRFCALSSAKWDRSTRAAFNQELLQLWLASRLDFIGSLMVLATCLMAISIQPVLPASTAGLAVSNSFQILLFWSVMCRTAADIDSNIASVERVKQLSFVEPEADKPLDHDSCPPDGWPSRGEISFHEVVMSYLPAGPHVLKGVTFTIRPGEKIGVAGRTGAGKSSLIMALYRLAVPAEGSVRVDGIDVSALNLAELRRRIAIIPQEPVMFAGTIRTNLDPFHEHTDAELARVLERAMLPQLANDLDARVEAFGGNLSLGAQQLICLARAMLNASRVLLLDEATAALDLESDAKVQRVLRTEFADRTVVTIAHRLDTIVDSDRVLIMGSGQVCEFDTPFALLQRPDSIFSSLCRQTGAQYEQLRAAAERHYQTMRAVEQRLADEDAGDAATSTVAMTVSPGTGATPDTGSEAFSGGSESGAATVVVGR